MLEPPETEFFIKPAHDFLEALKKRFDPTNQKHIVKMIAYFAAFIFYVVKKMCSTPQDSIAVLDMATQAAKSKLMELSDKEGN